VFLYQADRRIVGCHLVGRGAGRRGLVCLGPTLGFQPSMIMMARATRLAGDMPMVGRHEAICNMPGQRPAGASQITRSAAIAYACCVNSGCCVLLYQADQRDVVCHLVGRGCWMTQHDTTVLGANARFLTEYDSKGYGLMSLAGHTPKRWPVSSRLCDCRTSRPALHGAWAASFLTHTTVAHATLAYTTLLHTTFLHTTCSHAYTTISTHPHTQLLHTQLLHTHTSHLSNTHAHTHNSSTYNFLKLIDPPPPPLPFLPSPSRFNFSFSVLEEVELWGNPVL